MALWRDPLEELIADLERAWPVEVSPADWQIPPFEDVQLAMAAVLSGTPEDEERAARDPRVQAVYAYIKRLAAENAGAPATTS
jgi:hypothetical protein